MKKLLMLSLGLVMIAVFQLHAQTPKGGDEITLTCKIISPPSNAQTIFLYEQVGMAYREVAKGEKVDDQTFVIRLPKSEPKIYSVGFNPSQNGRIVLGQENDITLWANASFMEKGRTMGSEVNKAYESIRQDIARLQATSDELRIQLRQARAAGNTEEAQATLESLKAHEKEKATFLASLKKEHPMFWRSATLSLSPDFTKDQTGNSGELEFYSTTFFNYADLADQSYENVPEVFDAYRQYVLTVSQLGASTSAAKSMIDAQLAKLEPGTNIHRRALSGVLEGLKAANHPDYPVYTKQYIDTYRRQDYGEIGMMEFDLRRNSTFTPGMEAPDLVGNTPEGQPYALSNLRGKYVLIDFWASWCGPCRRENPNVVAMYEKYKDKGFDILGVSLDRQEDAWKKAIDQDGLKWHHISDLKGWKSEHAQLYSVTSIPQTLLIGPDGKIIQRNLRGPQLGAKLQELLGE